MKKLRFFAAMSRHRGSGPAPKQPRFPLRTFPPTEFEVVVDHPRFLLLASPGSETIVSERGDQVVIGPIFNKSTGKSLCGVSKRKNEDWDRLTTECWGHYLAFEYGNADRPCRAYRAPFGSLPCFYVETEQGLILGSDLKALATSGWSHSGIDWDQVLQHLLARDILGSSTCLTGLRELRGGTCLEVDKEAIRTVETWSPWSSVASVERPPTREAAIASVRDTVSKAVEASVAAARQPLVMLSGGIDSSIIAASLALASKPFTCLNLVSVDASGDERRYARLMAAACGVKLEEAVRRVENVHLTMSKAAHLPRPTARAFVQDSDRLIHLAAVSARSDLIVDGGGGDNVFCSLQSAVPVADALRWRAPWRETWRATRTISELAEASALTVARLAVRRAWLQDPSYRWPLDRLFLSDATAQVVPHRHPWLVAPKGAAPGAAAHIALLVAGQSWVEGLDPEAELPSVSPLLAQPVVETCLAIPSWWWFQEGLNRWIARLAFADLLPEAIVQRRSKASPDSFVAELFERNRELIRAMLLDGRVAAQGIVDTVALERALAMPFPAQGQSYRRIMRLVDVEAWTRCWT